MTYLGLDLGTSGLRALLIDETGQALASVEHSYDMQHPHPGWSEQDPQDWIMALDACMMALRAQVPTAFGAIKGMAVAGHMHGATCLDAQGQVLRPCILWNDTRSHIEAARLDATNGVRQTSGNIVFPGFTAPKLMWMAANEPTVFAQVAKVLLPAAYLNFYLTGTYVGDVSDAAGTAWLDVGTRDWSPALLAASGMQAKHMPALVEGCAPAGYLRSDLAQRWGLASSQIVVAGGAGDNAAAACGMGVLDQGQSFVSLGTSGVVLAARDGYEPAPETAVHSFCHAVPQRWYQMGVMLSATASLNWFAQLVGQKPQALTAALGEALSAPSALLFLPYLNGERTPHNDAAIRGRFDGLSLGSDRADMTQAVLQGVCFGLRDCAAALQASGAQVAQPFAIGGGSASHYWLSMLATVLNRPLALPQAGAFGAALGAARLAMVAATDADPAVVMTPPPTASLIEPETALVGSYDEAYQAFRAAYRAKQEQV